MIKIQKGMEPEGLKQLREAAVEDGLTPQEAYKTLRNPLKEQVRQNLINEQGRLCAYCMCRIPREDVSADIAPNIIEHVIPRNPADHRDVGQGLDYNNLLAVCHGNKAGRGTRQLSDLTCDAHRENIEFRKINPCDPETLETIFYSLDGKIGANDPDVNFDLAETLNLNCISSPLVSERKAVLDNLIADIGNAAQDNADSEIILDYCIQALDEFLAETNPKTPYVGVLIWYLQTMIEALTAQMSSE